MIGEEAYKVVFHGHIVDLQASKKFSCVIWYVMCVMCTNKCTKVSKRGKNVGVLFLQSALVFP